MLERYDYLAKLDESKLTQHQKKWLPHLRQASQDKISLTEYGKRYSVSSSSLYAVQSQLRGDRPSSALQSSPEPTTPPGFVPIAISHANPPSSKQTQLSIEDSIMIFLPNQIKIEIPGNLSHKLLTHVLGLL